MTSARQWFFIKFLVVTTKEFDIDYLPTGGGGLIGVMRRAADLRSEVADRPDVVLRQERAAKRMDIQPLVGRALEAAIVEVVAVDVDVGSHANP